MRAAAAGGDLSTAIVILSVGLLSLTAWNVTRSEAMLAARQAYWKEDFALALAHSLEHLHKQPWSGEAAVLAANCLSRLNFARGRAVLPSCRPARIERPADSGLWSGSRASARARDPSFSRGAGTLAQQRDGDAPPRWRLARLSGPDGRASHPGRALEKVSGGEIIGSTLRGVVYHNDQNPQQAVAAFERVLELDPELREMPLPQTLFWTELTDDLVSAGRIEDAARYLASAVSKTTDPSLLNRLGWTYLLRSMLDDADRCFRQAADLAPRDHVAYLNLAKLAVLRHDEKAALAHLNRARLSRPGGMTSCTAWRLFIVSSAARRTRKSSSSPSNNCVSTSAPSRRPRMSPGRVIHFEFGFRA